MRVMEVKVYKFEELPQNIKEKVLEKNRYINTEDREWYEYITDEWKTNLTEKGFTDAEISFSGFCSQGDGACFDARCDVSKLAAAVYSGKDEGFYREVLQLFADNGPCILAHIEKNSYGHHYSHANTRYTTVTKESFKENDIDKILSADLNQVPTMITEYDECPVDVKVVLSGLVELRLKYKAPSIGLDELLNRFEKHIDELRKSLSNEIYKELGKEYDYQTSDEAISEMINCNDYEFDESGCMI